jgi:predicted dehydrogenase
MLKVAIVGCGKIADSHAEHILHIPDCEIVGVCDREELMARQLQERLGIQAIFTEVKTLLRRVNPDVVHITTPPQSHYSLGKLCLEAGCHVYIEKPFTATADEAEELITFAAAKHLKLTVGHDLQFTHAANRMRQLIAEGYLGGPPVHMESYFCYDLGDVSYAKSLLGDPHHWIRNLSGGLLQNNISHGISKISEFLRSDSPTVIAHGFTSPLLRSIGETEIVDELRVIIEDRGGTTAYFTFSSQMRPLLHQLRLYGPKNGLMIDDDKQMVLKIRGIRYKSYLEQFVPSWSFANQYVTNCWRNTRLFLKADFHTLHGMRTLIEAFYRSITEKTRPPIDYKEILLTSRIMDNIFTSLKTKKKTIRTLIES